MNHILQRVEDGITFLNFNRPDRLNAVNMDLYAELGAKIQTALNDRQIRVIVLSGEGRAFSVGADLKEHRTKPRTEKEKRDYTRAEQEICVTIQQSQKPFIAAVNGYALGAGAEIALSCDFIIMKQSAEIGFPEISIGTYVGGGITYLLPRLVGLSKAREMMFLGKRITGIEAERIGLIYRCVPDEHFETEVGLLARELCEKAPIPLGLAKKHLLEHAHLDARSALDAEAEALFRCMQTEDWAEGVRAFQEKRRPVFHGK